MAVLAAYAARSSKSEVESGKRAPLEDFLSREVFKDAESETLAPTEDGMAGFDRYVANFKEAINA